MLTNWNVTVSASGPAWLTSSKVVYTSTTYCTALDSVSTTDCVQPDFIGFFLKVQCIKFNGEVANCNQLLTPPLSSKALRRLTND